MGNFNVLNLGVLLRNYDETAILTKLREYSCPINNEIDTFFHSKAVESV